MIVVDKLEMYLHTFIRSSIIKASPELMCAIIDLNSSTFYRDQCRADNCAADARQFFLRFHIRKLFLFRTSTKIYKS